ncbi:MAG: hypothetical protein LZ158_03365 [Thaumarchaeota archaeon]|nr:hypothetical protein [Candidatus Terraquivivens yellowstonensis]MCL7392218.1 hypothetical protein [Candidatus Terraquivivens yellowstonensis]MCL7397448.1 hypothetical protein [Candidatus Terraquivivens yellowstonensis]MCL7399406.1 hypothetical protein [Candidatus Terraquivivens yellowstonensis]MCL7400441.1 hypothetical protein [Candidatus Terraquivivens yellowstonensis]
MNSRRWAFAIMMGALGNALAAITVIPTMIQQVALDFSLLPAIIAGIYGGWALGGLTGFIAGILPSIWFGPLGSLGPLGITASIGKAIMGITVGLLSRVFKRWLDSRTWLYIPVVILAFLPEALWIYLVFAVMVPLFLPAAPAFLPGLWAPILLKGTFEVTVMGFFTAALAGHNGFKSQILSFLSPPSLPIRKA